MSHSLAGWPINGPYSNMIIMSANMIRPVNWLDTVHFTVPFELIDTRVYPPIQRALFGGRARLRAARLQSRRATDIAVTSAVPRWHRNPLGQPIANWQSITWLGMHSARAID